MRACWAWAGGPAATRAACRPLRLIAPACHASATRNAVPPVPSNAPQALRKLEAPLAPSRCCPCSRHQFVQALYLIDCTKRGMQMPAALPPGPFPPVAGASSIGGMMVGGAAATRASAPVGGRASQPWVAPRRAACCQLPAATQPGCDLRRPARPRPTGRPLRHLLCHPGHPRDGVPSGIPAAAPAAAAVCVPGKCRAMGAASGRLGPLAGSGRQRH